MTLVSLNAQISYSQKLGIVNRAYISTRLVRQFLSINYVQTFNLSATQPVSRLYRGHHQLSAEFLVCRKRAIVKEIFKVDQSENIKLPKQHVIRNLRVWKLFALIKDRVS